MKLIKFFAVYLTLVLGLLDSPGRAIGQIKVEIADEEPSDHFFARMGIGISPTQGIVSFKTYSLVDENGFSYDTMSLIHGVHKELGVSDEQYENFNFLKAGLDKDLDKLATSGLWSGNGANEAMRSRFFEAEEAFQELLSDEQRDRLEQLRHQQGVLVSGFAKHFTSSHFSDRSSASDKDIEALELAMETFRELRKEKALALIKSANEKFVENLTNEKQAALKKVIGDNYENSFLAIPLFTKSYSTKRKFVAKTTDLFRILKLKRVRTRIELPDQQYSQIKQIKRGETDELRANLSGQQSEQLDREVALIELKRMGTVNGICVGFLKQAIDLDDVEAKELYESGKEIQEELVREIKAMNQIAFSEAIEPLSDEFRDLIANSLGKVSDSLVGE